MSVIWVIWECNTNDGISTYFDNEPEAELFTRDCVKAGFSVRTQTITLPTTPKAFAEFMERQFNRYREVILAAHKLGENHPC